MIQIAAGTKVYLACQPVDMRRGFDGLSAEVVNRMNADPYSGHLFLFRGKRGDYLKALYWDGTGLCLFAKRLEHGKFVWPSLVDGVLQMSAAQLALLVEGMDWRRTLMPERPPKPTMA
ncbi:MULTISPECIES: IS66 family insertion sequence element accessory protein TnpB [Microvirga]|uniref:IS66 family insertion sequence element accessory protein TnpB n=1 Tax=Microvirga TaxID=186650 RepID=UPI001B370928|nr:MULTISPECIES: IS66 family insertion sequence element accessory protein TnpB [unclassified Microvirga]MBQ0820037.1 IS66 family insertion sequence element accessory protein TnpB [Microvirga sp. HBU67558]